MTDSWKNLMMGYMHSKQFYIMSIHSNIIITIFLYTLAVADYGGPVAVVPDIIENTRYM